MRIVGNFEYLHVYNIPCTSFDDWQVSTNFLGIYKKPSVLGSKRETRKTNGNDDKIIFRWRVAESFVANFFR